VGDLWLPASARLRWSDAPRGALIARIYNNTGRSVFAAALAHAMMNLSWIGPFQDYGPRGYPYHALRISALLMAIMAAIVTIAWGPRTLARHGNPAAASVLRRHAACQEHDQASAKEQRRPRRAVAWPSAPGARLAAPPG
jgi:hypothetical protein